MDNIERVRLTLEAIESVKAEARRALDQNDPYHFKDCMNRVITLESSLVGDATLLIDELDAERDIEMAMAAADAELEILFGTPSRKEAA